MGGRGVGGFVVENVVGFDGVEAVEADVAEGVVVGHLVIAIADFPIQHACGWEVVDVAVLHCRVGRFVPVVPGLQVLHGGVGAVAVDHVEHLIGLRVMEEYHGDPAAHGYLFG